MFINYSTNNRRKSIHGSKNNLTSVDPNPRLYQEPRGIKSPLVQTSLSAIPEKRFAPGEI